MWDLDEDDESCYEWPGKWCKDLLNCDTFKLIASRVKVTKQLQHNRFQIMLGDYDVEESDEDEQFMFSVDL